MTLSRRDRLPVPYAVDRQQILVAMTEINITEWRGAGSKVILEIVPSAQDVALIAAPLEPSTPEQAAPGRTKKEPA